jgi:hypothetical protein
VPGALAANGHKHHTYTFRESAARLRYTRTHKTNHPSPTRTTMPSHVQGRSLGLGRGIWLPSGCRRAAQLRDNFREPGLFARRLQVSHLAKPLAHSVFGSLPDGLCTVQIQCRTTSHSLSITGADSLLTPISLRHTKQT